MENKFRSLTIFEFQERFPDEASCYAYLSQLKWGTGFVCLNCVHTQYCNGKRKYDRECGNFEGGTADSNCLEQLMEVSEAFMDRLSRSCIIVAEHLFNSFIKIPAL